MNKKLLALTFCAFLNVSIWASESNDEFDEELADINSEENLTVIAGLTERLSRCSTGFQSASCNQNNGAFRAASRIQSSVTPDKQIEKRHEEIATRRRLGSITNTDMAAMETKINTKKRNGSIASPIIEEEAKDNTKNLVPVISIRPRSSNSLTAKNRRSASRAAYFATFRNYDKIDNDENSQAIKRK